jgi:glycosyltransferase involved in cell wall biosynthesis
VNRISAVMAVYNGERYLRECLDSMLGQSRPPDEIIVVDDGSTDRSSAIIEGYGRQVTSLRQPNAGQAAGFVAGLALATGDLLAFNDADDIWIENRLARQLEHLEADDTLDAVYGLSEQFVSPELPVEDQRRFTPRQALLVGEAAQCILLRRSAYDRIGGFDPTLRAASFIDWLGRAKRANYRSLMLDEVVHRRRLHPGNYGRTSQNERDRNLLSALRGGVMSRRRQLGSS